MSFVDSRQMKLPNPEDAGRDTGALLQDSDDLPITTLHDHVALDLRKDTEEAWALLVKHGRQPMEMIGAGSFGIVFRAHDKRLKRDVAIKVLRPSIRRSEQIVARFDFEAESACKCNSEGVVPVFEYANLDGTPIIVCQYVEGMSLATYIKQHRDEIDERMAIHLVRSVALVIHEIHQRCFLHRDIKPANILLEKLVSPSKSGLPFRPLVTDFGLAKLIAVGHDATVRSESSSIVGTLRYMSPEQAAGQSRLITVTTDVYSLGVVLYELIAQRPPFHEGSKLALIHSIIHDPAPSLRKAVPRVSRELEAIVAKCLEKNPNERYVSAKAFADDLQFYLEGKSTLARPATPIRSLLVWAHRNRVLSATICSIWFGMFALLVVIGVLYRRERYAVHVANNTADLAVEMAREYYQRLAGELGRQPGTTSERLKLHKDALSKFEKLAKIRSNDEYSRYHLSIAHHFVSNAESRIALANDSRTTRERAVQILDDLVKEFPDKIKYRFDLFLNCMHLGHSYADDRQLECWHKALENIQYVCNQSPDNPAYLDAMNAMLATMSHAYTYVDTDKARKYGKEALAQTEKLVAKYPDRPLYRKYIFQSHQSLGRVAACCGSLPETIEHFELSLRAFKEMEEFLPTLGERCEHELNIRTTYIESLQKFDDLDRMIPIIESCWPLLDGLEEWFPGDRVRYFTGFSLRLLHAESVLRKRETEGARNSLELARDLITKFASENEDDILSLASEYHLAQVESLLDCVP